jgi:hypothetical protein
LSGIVPHLLQAIVVSPTMSDRSPLNKTGQDRSIGNLECALSSLFGKVPHLSQATVVSPTKSNRSPIKKPGSDCNIDNNRLACTSINWLS